MIGVIVLGQRPHSYAAGVPPPDAPSRARGCMRYNMLIEHKERILKRGSGKGAAEMGIRSGQAEKQAQMRRRACEQGRRDRSQG